MIQGKNNWVELFTSEEIVEKDGLYIFVCRYDNHLDYEAYFLNKGEKYWKYFIDEFTHSNGWQTIDPLAVDYIPPYDKDNSEWKNISQGCYNGNTDLCILAKSQLNTGISNIQGFYNRNTDLCIVAYTLDDQIKYAFFSYELDPIEDDEFNKKYKNRRERINYFSSIRHKIKMEGMYLFHKYNEEDHIKHWQQPYQQRKKENSLFRRLLKYLTKKDPK